MQHRAVWLLLHIVCEIGFPGEAGDVALPTRTLPSEFGGVFSEVQSCSRHPFPALRDIPSSREVSTRDASGPDQSVCISFQPLC